MRATVIRRSLVATATLAVAAVTGCTPQTVDSKGEGAPIRTTSNPAPEKPQKPREQEELPETQQQPQKPAAHQPSEEKPAAAAQQSGSQAAHRKPADVQQAADRPSEPEPVMAPGSEGATVRELQARLRQLDHFRRSPTGYYGWITANAVAAFQDAHGLVRTGKADLKTWLKVRDLTDVPTREELFPSTTLQPSKPDPRCTTGRALCISKSSRTLQWMVNGKVRSAMDVRFGSELTPTREGLFSVFWKSRDHVSTLYDTPMPYALFFSGGQAVHFSADFAANGYNGASHGCVNVRDKEKIAQLFDQVKNGDKVVVYK